MTTCAPRAPGMLTVVFLYIAVCGGPLTSLRAEVRGNLELLKKVARLQLENIDKIRQWAGTAELQFRETEKADNYLFTQTVSVNFACDRDRDAVCFRWLVLESQAKKAGEEPLVNSLKGGRIGALLIGDKFYKMSLTVPGNPFSVSVSARPEQKIHIGGTSQVFYPMRHFDLIDDSPEEFFRWKIELADRDWALLKIDQHEDTVFLEVYNKTLKDCGHKFTFDLSKSGMLVKTETFDELLGTTQTTKWEQIDGVFLPSVVKYRNARNDESEISEKTVRWTKHVLNQPIPDSAFTLEAMGVPAGATLTDRRTMATWLYEPKEKTTVTSQGRPSDVPTTVDAVADPVVDATLPQVQSSGVTTDDTSDTFVWSVAAILIAAIAAGLLLRKNTHVP